MENPKIPRRGSLGIELQQDPGELGEGGKRNGISMLVQALDLFGKTGFFWVVLRQSSATNTISHRLSLINVISRQGLNGMKRFFGGGITDQLL